MENIPAEPKSSTIKYNLMQFFVTYFSDTQDLPYQVGYPNILIYDFVSVELFVSSFNYYFWYD